MEGRKRWGREVVGPDLELGLESTSIPPGLTQQATRRGGDVVHNVFYVYTQPSQDTADPRVVPCRYRRYPHSPASLLLII
jgi:hypothetical protein